MRPDPDELIARMNDAESAARRGKLTIFFGSAPGVGKTYAMLVAARAEVEDESRDVVVGIVETHGRKETAALVLGLEMLPRKHVAHRGITLEELDLDAALARRPAIVVVDELAHTNAPGLRHTKRWQDVEELLAAGIDVYTTLNVQHLESLNDVVAQITGVVVRETVPDEVFEGAYEVRVVDLPVDELRDRLREGKVYGKAQAERAAQEFFREGNLTALRELALRRTAERVEAKMRSYKAAHGIEATWATSERILVCVSPSPSSERLIRAARRMAASAHAELLGVYVETPAAVRLGAADRERLARNMRLVESLGGESITLRGEDAATETVAYARKRNVTKIVLGKPTHSRWRDLLRTPFLDDVVRKSREIDVHVISGSAPATGARTAAPAPTSTGTRATATRFAPAAALVSLATVTSALVFGRAALADVVMVHLLAIVVVSMRYGRGPAIFATFASVLAVDALFVPPYMSLAVTDLRHVVTFGVMFVVALVISHLTSRIRDQADSAREREQRTASLFAVARDLGNARSRSELFEMATGHVGAAFHAQATIHLPSERHGADDAKDDKTAAAVAWALRHTKPAGASTETLPTASALAMPLVGSKGAVGVMTLAIGDPSLDATARETIRRLRDPDERQLLETICKLIGSALERTQLEDDARDARLRAETEHLRNALLSSVSHDLRTPLGVVTGATSAILDAPDLDPASRRELVQTAHDEAVRLSRLVRNLLDMTRLEAGALALRSSSASVEEIVGSVLARFGGRALTTTVPSELEVHGDAVLLAQALINLVENAVKYSPATEPIHVEARERDGMVEIDVADRGDGVSDSDKTRIFQKFFRAHETEGGGVGLGLTVARGIAEAHGGSLSVLDREGGGALFRISVPATPRRTTESA